MSDPSAGPAPGTNEPSLEGPNAQNLSWTPPSPAGPEPSAGPPPGDSWRSGPPWEDPARGLFERYFATLMEVFGQPSDFFDNLRLRGGIAMPLAYGVIGLSIGSIVTTMYSTALQLMPGGDQGWWIAQTTESMRQLGLPAEFIAQFESSARATAHELARGALTAVLMAPFMAAFALLVVSGVIHLFLAMLGGAREPFEATLRVASYAWGALAWLQLFPCCGRPVFFIWALGVTIIGLTRTHRSGAFAAAGAVLGPLLSVALCCCAALLMLALAL